MDEQKRPRSREKKIIGEGKDVEKKGEGLGTGPLNNTGNYEGRKEQQSNLFHGIQRPSGSQSSANRPVQENPFGKTQGQMPDSTEFPFGSGQSTGKQDPFTAKRPSSGSGNPIGNETPRQYNSARKVNGTTSGTHRASGAASGGGGQGKILLVIIALVVLLGGGGLSGLFGGGDDNGTSANTNTNTNTISTNQSSGTFGTLSNLLNSFMGSSGNSVYDYTGSSSSLTNLLTGGSNSSGSTETQYFTTSSDNNSIELDESVSKKAREKFTVIRGNNRDTVTILVYMCGSDLESQQGMATSDLKEMANATIGSKINLLIYTGGCSRWKNNVISSRYNQIYRISDGKFECLEDNMGTGSMVSPETLVSFINYGKKNYSADRMCLILWDHGGGSVSGFGYDEKTGHNQSMSLSGINTALKTADVKFDFIGFDACLMATVENGIMLSQYADYMIASEETEPGVGWYYTNWLTKLSSNTSMPTIQIGKMIADDFVNVCDKQCRGQATTLSVVDLAELCKTIPEELTNFSIGTNNLIQNKEYRTVATARSKSREFAQQSRIDQIDLVDFANNLKTTEGKNLAKALQSAVKYNKTGGGISHAYGLSIYFPYKQVNKVNQMVYTYKAIGMDEEYARCIQEFASLEISGQVSAGTSITEYGSSQNASSSLLGTLLGQSSGYTSSYSQSGLEELLGGLYGGGTSSGYTGSIMDLFTGRNMTKDDTVSYILENHFDASGLVWQNGKIILSAEQWGLVTDVIKNVFYDDGNGFIDLGCDNDFEISANTLIDNFDGTWLSINRQPIAYYYLGTVEEGEDYVISGYTPAYLNGERVNLILQFDSERPDGYIAGAQKVYSDTESGTQAKTLIVIGKGDEIQFLCDYYDYDGNYRDSYKLGNPITLGETTEIGNTIITNDMSKCIVTYRFTDIYYQDYWTPAVS